MTGYTVVFTPEAEDQLVELYGYLADKATPAAAERYTGSIITYCESMKDFPHRGTRREDLRPGLRMTN